MSTITYTAKRKLVNDTAGFVALLNDAGSGAVDTSLWRGTGAATFVRATAAACRLSTGLWKLDVASGVARSHYLADLTYGGYLSEAAATQLITPSAAVRDMTNAAWVKVTMTTAKTSVGIDGVSNACTQLTATGANATAKFTLTAAASSRTYSCFIQRVTGSGNIQLTQDNGGTWTTVSLPLVGFNLVQLNASVLNAVFGIRIVTSGDSINVDCNQFEAGGAATTPIPAAGTRNEDMLSYPSPGNATITHGTIYAEISPLSPTAAFPSLNFFSASVSDGTGNNAVEMVNGGSPSRFRIISGGAPSADISVGSMSSETVFKQAAVWEANYAQNAKDGTLGVADVSVTIPANFTQIDLGRRYDGPGSSKTIKNVRIYITRASDAVLQQMTMLGTDYAHLPGTSYTLESYAEMVTRSVKTKRTIQQPLDDVPPEVVLYRQETFYDVMLVGANGDLITEAVMAQYREFLASVAAGELFTFDRYGTVAVPVEPKSCMLSSEDYTEERITGAGNLGLYKLGFQVRVFE